MASPQPRTALPEALLLEEPYDLHGSPLFARGALMPQSRASMLVARAVDPQPGERVLDLCAAPGGKTTHLAALMGDEGAVIAVELHPRRADASPARRAPRRDAASKWSAATRQSRRSADFDRVLVDPPCSDLGTLRRRPDARWRKTPEQVARLARSRPRSSRRGAGAAAGGPLVYSTCTISPAENERVIAAFLADRPEFEADDLRASARLAASDRALVPSDAAAPRPHGGFFIARLRRRAGAVTEPEVRPGAGAARAAMSRGCGRPTCRAAIAA